MNQIVVNRMNIVFNPNDRKIEAAVAYIIDAAEREGVRASIYQIVKSILTADLTHMKKYGRPVTFDNYVAMEYGPVPSRSYDILRRFSQFWDKDGFTFSNAKYAELMDILSESDEDELLNGWSFISKLSFEDISTLTHSLEAWQRAWDGRTGNVATIALEQLFEYETLEELENSAIASRNV